MAQPVISGEKLAGQTEQQGGVDRPPNRPTTSLLEEARKAVHDFLGKEPNVRDVRVTKLAQIDAQEGTWEAEADVYVPNETIRTLGLPVRKEVLERKSYLLRLNRQLQIVAYGSVAAVEAAVRSRPDSD